LIGKSFELKTIAVPMERQFVMALLRKISNRIPDTLFPILRRYLASAEAGSTKPSKRKAAD